MQIRLILSSKCSETTSLVWKTIYAKISCGKYNHSEQVFKSFDFLKKKFYIALDNDSETVKSRYSCNPKKWLLSLSLLRCAH